MDVRCAYLAGTPETKPVNNLEDWEGDEEPEGQAYLDDED